MPVGQPATNIIIKTNKIRNRNVYFEVCQKYGWIEGVH